MKYAEFVKYSRQELTSRHLEKIYGIRQECTVLPFIPDVLSSLKRKSECWIPTTILLDIVRLPSSSMKEATEKLAKFRQFLDKVDMTRFRQSLDPIKSYFGIQTNMLSGEDNEGPSYSLITDRALNSDQCQIRCEVGEYNRVVRKFHIMNIADL